MKLNQPPAQLVAALATLAAILATATAGYLLWQNQELAKLATQPSILVYKPAAPVPTKPNKIDPSTWQTYLNDKYGFEVKYPTEWIISESLGQQVEQDRGILLEPPPPEGGDKGYPIYAGRGQSCDTPLMWGIYNDKQVQIADATNANSNIRILLGDFSNSSKIYVDDLSGPGIADFNALEMQLNGNVPLQKDWEYPRKQIGSHWAFYSDVYTMVGGPCDIDPATIPKLNYISYEFMNDGQYFVIQISTPEADGDIFDQILATFKFIPSTGSTSSPQASSGQAQ